MPKRRLVELNYDVHVASLVQNAGEGKKGKKKKEVVDLPRLSGQFVLPFRHCHRSLVVAAGASDEYSAAKGAARILMNTLWTKRELPI